MAEVKNNVTLKLKDTQIKAAQTFAMAAGEKAPLMNFSLSGKPLAQIRMTDGGSYRLVLNMKAFKNCPFTDKLKINEKGLTNFAIEPVGDAAPIDLSHKNGGIVVRIKSKDGSADYTCRINAFGISLEYDGQRATYSAPVKEGAATPIDVTMSTTAFEKLCSGDKNWSLDENHEGVKLNYQSSALLKQMVGLYAQTKTSETEANFAEFGFEGYQFLALAGENNEYHYLIKTSDNQVLQYNKGTLSPISKPVIVTRDEVVDGKTIHRAYISVEANGRHTDYAVPTNKDGSPSVKTVQAFDKFTNFEYGQKGNEDKQKKVNGHFIKEFDDRTLQQAQHIIRPVNMVIEDEAENEDEETDQQNQTDDQPQVATQANIDQPVKTQPKRERHAEGALNPHTSTPMGVVSEAADKDNFKKNKIKLDVKPEYGYATAVMGGALMFLSAIFPFLSIILIPLGFAATAAGFWVAVNAERLSNPYLKLEEYVFDPLTKKQRAFEKEQEHFWEQETTAQKMNSQAKEAGFAFEEDQANFLEHITEGFSEENAEALRQFMIDPDNMKNKEAFLEKYNQLLKSEMNSGTDDAKALVDAHFPTLSDDEKAALSKSLFDEGAKEFAADLAKLNDSQKENNDKAKEIRDLTGKKIREGSPKYVETLLGKYTDHAKRSEFIENYSDDFAQYFVMHDHKNIGNLVEYAGTLTDAGKQSLTQAIDNLTENCERIKDEASSAVSDYKDRSQEIKKYKLYKETLEQISKLDKSLQGDNKDLLQHFNQVKQITLNLQALEINVKDIREVDIQTLQNDIAEVGLNNRVNGKTLQQALKENITEENLTKLRDETFDKEVKSLKSSTQLPEVVDATIDAGFGKKVKGAKADDKQSRMDKKREIQDEKLEIDEIELKNATAEINELLSDPRASSRDKKDVDEILIGLSAVRSRYKGIFQKLELDNKRITRKNLLDFKNQFRGASIMFEKEMGKRKIDNSYSLNLEDDSKQKSVQKTAENVLANAAKVKKYLGLEKAEEVQEQAAAHEEKAQTAQKDEANEQSAS